MAILKKGGITVEMNHPTDIARYKRLGYVEVKPEQFAQDQQAEAEKAVGTGSQVAPETEPETPKAPEPAPESEKPKKGKAKK